MSSMGKKKYIFAIRSPYCYVNALELREYLNLIPEQCYLVIGYKEFGDIDTKQFQGLCDEQQWAMIAYAPVNMDAYLLNTKSSNREKSSIISKMIVMKGFVQSINALIPEPKNVGGVILQNIEDYLFLHVGNSLNPEVVYCLDEGSRTICTATERKNDHDNTSIVGLVLDLKKRLMSLVYKYNVNTIKRIKYFSCYKVPLRENDELIVNRYEVLNKKLHYLPRDERTVLFIGSSMSEVGVVTEEYCICCLKQITQYFAGKKIQYVAHRGDSARKLERIKREVGMNVVKYNIPFEITIAKRSSIPSCIASFYSSVLVNCFKMFDENINTISFRLSEDELSEKHRDAIEAIYKYFSEIETEKFQLIEMEKIQY